jgi:hypothetical protein
MKAKTNFKLRFLRDVVTFAISIGISIFISKLGIFDRILLGSAETEFFGALISGFFFTSFLTTPLSIAAFATLAGSMDPLVMAALGAFGAVIGDLILFVFIRHTFKEDMDHLLSLPSTHKIVGIFRRRVFRWLLPLLGALVIASPLPDELGIAMMCVSSMKIRQLIGISVLMNFLGILFIGILAA